MRFDRRFLPVVLAVLLPACGGEESPFKMIPDEDAGDITMDDAGPGPMFPDRGFPADEGTPEEDVPSLDAGRRDAGSLDAGVRDTGVVDTGVRDTGVIDTGPVDTGPAPDPCATAVDLATAGTVTGQITSYTGSNATAPTGSPLRAACSSATRQVVLRYTPRASVRLRISTNNDGTAASLDTVLWAQAACTSLPAGNMGLGCNDDSLSPPRTLASSFTTEAAVTAGTPIFIVVGGFTGSTGTFALTVTEVVPAMAGGACDPRDLTSCVTGLRCVPTGTSTTIGTCIADGAAGGRCRTMGLSCDAGLTCSGVVSALTSRCRATVAVGGMCDPAGAANICAEGANCITAAGMSTCITDGAAGGRCRPMGTACDATLVCSGSQTSTTSRCRGTIAVGGDCDVTGMGDPCVTGSTCLTVSGRSVCMADGALNGRCRMTGAACDASLGCTGTPSATASRCVTAVAVGGACTATSICATGSTCLASGGGMVCMADGAEGGRCRGTGVACDAGLACNGTQTAVASRCVTAVAVGGACTAMSLCTSGSTCVASGGGMVCLTDGAVGGRCRGTGAACDTGLACDGTASAATSRCRTAVAVGAACDPAGVSSLCATGSYCALAGTDRWTCVANGARGGLCRGTSCDSGLVCIDALYCGPVVSAGSACDPTLRSSLCNDPTSCVARAGESSGTCVTSGSAAGTECRVGRTCSAGLTCSAIGEYGWCRTAAAAGEACDRTGRYTTCARDTACTPTTGNAGVCSMAIAETEPNNTPATAAPTITSSTAFQGTVESGGRDCVAVTVPMGAALFSEVQIPAMATCPAGGPDPFVEVYNPAGVLIAVEDDSPGRGRCSLIDPTFHPELRNLAAGRYVVCLREYGNTRTIPNYLFTVGIVR